MRRNKFRLFIVVLLCFIFTTPLTVYGAITITSNQTGTHDGYDYELWKD